MVLMLVLVLVVVVVKRSGQGSREVYWPVCVMAPLAPEMIVLTIGNCGVGGGEEIRPEVKGGVLVGLCDGSSGLRNDCNVGVGVGVVSVDGEGVDD